MTQPSDFYPQPQAQPNVPPSWGGLAPADLAGINHSAPGTFTPSSNALATYAPLRVLARHGGHAWVVPVVLSSAAASQTISFEYGPLGISPGVRSIGFRGTLAANQQVWFTDAVNGPCLLAANNGSGVDYVIGNVPVLSFRDRFQAIVQSGANFLAGSQIVLYEEEQLPIMFY